MKNLVVILSIAVFSITHSNKAEAEEGFHSVGLTGGQVVLTGDVGARHGNALGVGVFFDYAASDFLEFLISYGTSKHSSNAQTLDRSNLEFGVLYNIDEIDIFVPYLKGGAEFVSHKQDYLVGATNVSASTSGFGLNFGAGAKVLLGKDFLTGLDFTYHSAFDVSVTPTGSTTSQKAIQPYSTIMVLVGYRFGGKGGG